MHIDLPGWSQLILALCGVMGAIGAQRLNRRGQVTQARQQNAANELALRAQGFDEMEALVDRLTAELARVEARAERQAEVQARRCRIALEHYALAFTTLQSQVVSETARQLATVARLEAEAHLAGDHPDDNGQEASHD